MAPDSILQIFSRSQRHPDRRVLLAFLLAALNGLFFVFLAPPWQHYDEPNHFEYVWLLANRNQFPAPGDSDPKLSRQVLKSMISNNFYRGAESPPVTPGQTVSLPGYSQLDDPPAYYLLAALPVALLKSTPVAAQLYGARLASWLLFLLAVLAGWGIAAQFTLPGHPLRWMLPFSLGMLPAFVDLMSAVNNDVGAIAIYSLFLWSSVRLVRQGPSLAGLLAAAATAGLCLFTKVTAASALLLLPLAVVLSLASGRLRWPAWALIGLCVAAALLAVFGWGDAAAWGRISQQTAPTRAAAPAAPLGNHAFRLDLPAGESKPAVQLDQVLALPDGQSLKGQAVTVGAWMWADRPMPAMLPAFQTYDGKQKFSRAVQLSDAPAYYTYTVWLPGDAQRNWLTLAPQVGTLSQPASIYYDGLLVLPGAWQASEAPQFDTPAAASGAWGSQPFHNLVRNASAENTWPRLRPWVDRLGERLLPDPGFNVPSIILYSLLDRPGSQAYLSNTARILHESLWGVFAWGQIRLQPDWIFTLLAMAVLLGIGGALVCLLRRRSDLPWEALFLLGAAILIVLVQAISRGSNYLILPGPIYYPRSRYLFPVIIPIMLLLNAGWLEIGRDLRDRLHLPPRLLLGLYLAGWLAVDAFSILTIARYYYG